MHELLSKMAALDGEHPLAVDADTAREAAKVLGWLSTNRSNLAPKVMPHGGDAVTFTWDYGNVDRYLTVTGNDASELYVDKVSRKKSEVDLNLADPDELKEWLEAQGYDPTPTSVDDDYY